MNQRSFRAIRALTAVLAMFISGVQAMVDAPPAIIATRAPGCGNLSGPDAAQALSRLPAPRVVLLQGSVPIVTMESFARFLIAMGYPEAALRDPNDGALSRSSFGSSAELAGALAWHYERDGMRPILIGHSQGGMLVVRTVHELAGGFQESVPVFDPGRGAALERTTIRDPYTHKERPVVGVEVAFAAAIATGTLPRFLLGQWSMIPLLRRIPDTAVEFTGFTIAWDPLAGNLGDAASYTADGRAEVRNVLLPSTYSHIGAPITEHLAAQAATRTWIDAWRPDAVPNPVPDATDDDLRNLVLAADLWFSIRHHWCLEGHRRLPAPA